MTTSSRVVSDLAIPPGEYLAEVLEEFGMTQAELARRIGRPVQAINEIVQGTKALTPDTALQLENVLPVPAQVWTTLEAEYQLIKARHEHETRLRTELSLVREFPYAEMARWQWVAPTRHPHEKLGELLRFLGVASLHNLPNLRVSQAAFRRAERHQASPYALSAWLRVGELAAAKVTTAPFDAKALRARLPDIVRMSCEAPETFVPRLHETLARCGVALALVPHLKGTYAHGAAYWTSPDKAVVQLSLRFKYADIFFFSLLHEIGHVLLHGKKQVFIEEDQPHDRAPEELEADQFASRALIPGDAYASFVRGAITEASVRAFAREHCVAPGLLVGRLQHDQHLTYAQLTHLRAKYEWQREP